jgi:hypothetical protein
VPRGGDVRGALKALINANEFLERDFGKLLTPQIFHAASGSEKY